MLYNWASRDNILKKNVNHPFPYKFKFRPKHRPAKFWNSLTGAIGMAGIAGAAGLAGAAAMNVARDNEV